MTKDEALSKLQLAELFEGDRYPFFVRLDPKPDGWDTGICPASKFHDTLDLALEWGQGSGNHSVRRLEESSAHLYYWIVDKLGIQESRFMTIQDSKFGDKNLWYNEAERWANLHLPEDKLENWGDYIKFNKYYPRDFDVKSMYDFYVTAWNVSVKERRALREGFWAGMRVNLHGSPEEAYEALRDCSGYTGVKPYLEAFESTKQMLSFAEAMMTRDAGFFSALYSLGKSYEDFQ